MLSFLPEPFAVDDGGPAQARHLDRLQVKVSGGLDSVAQRARNSMSGHRVLATVLIL